MSDVSRDEFDKLVGRVDRIERTLGATVEIMSAEIVGLRTYLDEKFAHLEEHFNGRIDDLAGQVDGIDGKLDRYTEQVNVAVKVGSDATARNERFSRAIADHFGIELPEP